MRYKHPLDVETIEKLALGKITYVLSGTVIPCQLTPPEMVAFEKAKNDGYAIKGSPSQGLNNIWWFWCERIHWPFIMAEIKEGLGRVEYEAREDAFRLEPEWMGALSDFLVNHVQHFQVRPERVEAWGIPIDELDAVCRAILSVGRGQSPKPPRPPE